MTVPKVVPPSYEEMKAALLALDNAWQHLLYQIGSNLVKDSFGNLVVFTEINRYRQAASGAVYAARNADADLLPVVQKPTLQMYLENSDEYSFKDLLLSDAVEQEQRRQSKNQPEVEAAHVIQDRLEEELNQDGSIDFAVMIFKALQKAAKGQ